MNFEIYFSDLTPKAQARYLAALGGLSPDELNHEIWPSGYPDHLDYPTDAYSTYDEALEAFQIFIKNDIEDFLNMK